MNHTTGTFQSRATTFSEEGGCEEGVAQELVGKIKDSEGHLVAGVYHRVPDICKSVDFLLEIQKSSCLHAFILMENFNHLHVCWESGTADCKQSRRLLECTEDNFLVPVLDKPTREAVLLDLVLTVQTSLLERLRWRQPWL